MSYRYLVRCDGCETQATEWDGYTLIMPAGWHSMSVKPLGKDSHEIHLCPACYTGKTCAQVLAKVRFR
jgi:hypothetical protein